MSTWRPHTLLPKADHVLRSQVHDWLCERYASVVLRLRMVSAVTSAAPEAAAAAAAAAAALEAHDGAGKVGIAVAGGIIPLVKLVSCGGDATRRAAAAALAALASHPANKREIAAAGGVRALVAMLLAESPEESKAAACEAIWHLATGSGENRALLVQEGALPPVVALVSSQVAQSAAVRVLRQVAVDVEHARRLVDAGVIHPLLQLFIDASPARVDASEILWSLCMEPTSREAVSAAGGASLWWLYPYALPGLAARAYTAPPAGPAPPPAAASDCGDDPWVPAADVAFTDQDLLCFLREEDVEGSHDS